MSGQRIWCAVAGHLARLTARRATINAASGAGATAGEADAARDDRLDRVRYHLGCGRRAREAGRYRQGAHEARRALVANPSEPWALALLGQCLSRQSPPDLQGARHALERAQSLDPTNGYFVRLLIDLLDAQGDAAGCADALARAWWQGAPVERWLPDGPPRSRPASLPAPVTERVANMHEAPRNTAAHPPMRRAQPVPA